MRLWMDDTRPAPAGWRWAKSVNEAKELIYEFEKYCNMNRMEPGAEIEVISMDHDAGEFASDGGDYIKLLDWFEEEGYVYPIHLHTMNPVGRERMRAIIQRNGWTEIQ